MVQCTPPLKEKDQPKKRKRSQDTPTKDLAEKDLSKKEEIVQCTPPPKEKDTPSTQTKAIEEFLALSKKLEVFLDPETLDPNYDIGNDNYNPDPLVEIFVQHDFAIVVQVLKSAFKKHSGDCVFEDFMGSLFKHYFMDRYYKFEVTEQSLHFTFNIASAFKQ